MLKQCLERDRNEAVNISRVKYDWFHRWNRFFDNRQIVKVEKLRVHRHACALQSLAKKFNFVDQLVP